MEKMKHCPDCNTAKPASEYNKRRASKDGLQPKCRACDNIRSLNRYALKAEDAREYYQRNKKRITQVQLKYQKKRYENDPEYNLIRRTRRRVINALDGIGKDASTMELLGCTARQFREHIESQFVDGMAWGQRGSWSVDHYIPISAFDMTKPKHQRYAFHWSNCQPLWTHENLSKADKYCPKELKKYLASPLMEYREKGKR